VDIDGFEQFELIGRGGFSTVYKAHQTAFDRTVAIKVLEVDASDEVVLRRFQRECELAGRLTGHPYVVTPMVTGVTEDIRPFLVMEYCPGGTVIDRVRRSGPMNADDAVDVAIKLAGALHSAHLHRFVHRDVKPHNVVFNRVGEPGLTDFGIAVVSGLTESSVTTEALTPTHAAPEVLRGEPATPASDIYSLGSTLYVMLAGTSAFGGAETGPYGVMGRVLNEAPARIEGIDQELWDIVEWTMAKDASSRPGSCRELAQELAHLQQRRGIDVTEFVVVEPAADYQVPDTVDPDSWIPERSQTSPRRRRRRRIMGSIAMVAVVIALIVGAGFLGARVGTRGGEVSSSASPASGAASPAKPAGLERPPGMQTAEYPSGSPDRTGDLRVDLTDVGAAFSSMTSSPLITKDFPFPSVKGYPALVSWNFINPVHDSSCRTLFVSDVRIDGFVQRALTNADVFALVYVQRLADPTMALQSFVGQSLELGADNEDCTDHDEAGALTSAAASTVSVRVLDLGDLGDVAWNSWVGATNPVPGSTSYTAIAAEGTAVVRVDVSKLQGGDVSADELRDVLTKVLALVNK